MIWLAFLAIACLGEARSPLHALSARISSEPRILNGFDADITVTPWYVALQYNSQYICGAALIDTQWVVTSGGCTVNRVASSFTVLAGIENTGDDESLYQQLAVDAIYLHEDYDTTVGGTDNDLAVLHLSQAVMLTDRCKPILLPNTPNNWMYSPCVTCGWGSVEQNSDLVTYPDHLQCMQANVITNVDCAERVVDVTNSGIRDTNLCIYDETTGACYDDHGSPLACVSEDSGSNTEELAGILSWIVVVQVTGAENREACSLVHPVVYTRISEYTDWIEGITGTLRRI